MLPVSHFGHFLSLSWQVTKKTIQIEALSESLWPFDQEKSRLKNYRPKWVTTVTFFSRADMKFVKRKCSIHIFLASSDTHLNNCCSFTVGTGPVSQHLIALNRILNRSIILFFILLLSFLSLYCFIFFLFLWSNVNTTSPNFFLIFCV